MSLIGEYFPVEDIKMRCLLPTEFDRVASAVDIGKMTGRRVALVGCGGSADLACNLVRSGLGRMTLVDPDTVGEENICRQGFMNLDCGRPKVEALKGELSRINSAAEVTAMRADFTAMTDAEVDEHLGDPDLLIFATDHFPAQARGNEVALRLRKPALWIGLYEGAGAGEIVWWRPGLPCFRCLCTRRYEAQAKKQTDPKSDGADIFSISLLDSIAGMIALGLLTRGSDNRFGRLVDQLGDRNFLQVMLDPSYRFHGKDLFRDQLQVPEANDRLFAWSTLARRDPDKGLPACPDCVRYGNMERPFAEV